MFTLHSLGYATIGSRYPLCSYSLHPPPFSPSPPFCSPSSLTAIYHALRPWTVGSDLCFTGRGLIVHGRVRGPRPQLLVWRVHCGSGVLRLVIHASVVPPEKWYIQAKAVAAVNLHVRAFELRSSHLFCTTPFSTENGDADSMTSYPNYGLRPTIIISTHVSPIILTLLSKFILWSFCSGGDVRA